jgi:hypothetical protein
MHAKVISAGLPGMNPYEVERDVERRRPGRVM